MPSDERSLRPTICNYDIRHIVPELRPQVESCFQMLADAHEDLYFSPHPFTPEHAAYIAEYSGMDFYCLGLYNNKAVAYGLLRGWDEGYRVPSLGIAVDAQFRGMGIGLAMMYYLHAVAALRGSEKVRLRVHRKNIQAQSLYQKMGYRFQDDSKGQEYLLGYAELSRHLQTRGI